MQNITNKEKQSTVHLINTNCSISDKWISYTYLWHFKTRECINQHAQWQQFYFENN